LDSTQRQLLGIQDHLLFKDFFRAHETSHQWWGHRVSWKSYHDQWLSEGFAEFSGNLYIQFRRNESVYLARLRDQKKELLSLGDLGRRRYESVGPIWMGQRLSSAEYRGAYFYVVYNKGGWVLHMLRMMLHDPRNPEPDTRFINLMQEFTRTYHNQPASTEDFKAMVEKHMTPSMDLDGNRKMDWFFHQYVYGTGIPQYEFKYQLQDAGGGRWKLTGQVTQSAVPDGWKEMLPLYLNIGGRTARVAFINVKERVTSFDLTLPAKPENVAICLKEDVLAQIQQ
jgi:aminopeptidase N